MPEPYNLTALNNQNDLFSFMDAANDLAGGIMGNLILLTVFIIMVFAWRTYEPKRSFAAASFITALFSILLRVLDWIPDATMFICFILAGVSFVLLRWD